MLPKPRLVFQVGITGHRLNKLEGKGPALVEAGLQKVFAAIERTLSDISRDAAGRAYSAEPPLVRIVTALAEGADRLAVAAAPAGAEIAAVLPMPRAEYARDFENDGSATSLQDFDALLSASASVTELAMPAHADPSAPETRARQYELAGAFMLRQIDLLIAVWDGESAAGRGGTAAVIVDAVAQGIEVVWIDPKTADAPQLIVALDAADVMRRRVQPCADPEIARIMRGILLPPPPKSAADPHAAHDHAGAAAPAHEASHPASAAGGSASGDLAPYFHAAWPQPMRLAFPYTLLRRLCGAGRWSWPIAYPGYDQLALSWEPFLAAMPHEGARSCDAGAGRVSLDGRIRAVLLPRSIWADALAWQYGQLYRSAYVAVFVLASLSVPIGLSYLFLADSPAILEIKALFVLIELALIAGVIVIVRRGVAEDWHGLWLQTRELSELLRLGRSLAYLGALRELSGGGVGHAGAPTSLPTWYARATFRELGLPSGVLDADYLGRVLDGTLRTEITEQKEYHRGNAANLGKIDHALHTKGEACFVATIAVLCLYLAAWLPYWLFGASGVAHAAEVAHDAHAAAGGGWGVYHHVLHGFLKPLVSVAAAGLPAIGAALAGIRAQGDFEGFASRSAGTHRELAEIEQRIAELLAGPGTQRLDLTQASAALVQAARVMAADVNAWRQLYVSKRLVLPA